jgi:ferrochelatase
MTRTGILIANLGTPDEPETKAVRRYLREFLSDERVLDISAALRTVLVNGIIAPLRGPKSAAAYKTVWTERGSPLLAYSLELRDALRERLPGVPIELGMRYGEPSMRAALEALVSAGCDRVVLAPLYPQYASSSTGSSVARAYEIAAEAWNTPFLDVLPPFFDEPRYLDAQAALIRDAFEAERPDHVLFSYHGLPERHCRKSDPTGAHCLAGPDCCAQIVDANRNCYRAQCYATTRGLVERLGLTSENHSLAFQSRLGRDPWIQPFTDERVPELARSGCRKLLVACPSFVADCLETIEEIGDRAKEDFLAAGGEELVLVPCLNADPRWCDALGGMLRERVGASAHS